MKRCIAMSMLVFISIIGSVQGGALDKYTVGPVSDQRFTTVYTYRSEHDDLGLIAKYQTLDQWKTRADDLRKQVLASCGLLPMPEKIPLHPRITSKIDRGDYTVENVSFESLPGFFVTGNLYCPKGSGPFPAVLNANGHWSHGRFTTESAKEAVNVPGRCINFAKQGYVTFAYSMIGYDDNRQMPHLRIGGKDEQLWGISIAGLQTWNSIRALDFVQSLPNVDSSRIACTGASGGATQTFLISTVDDRVTVSAPVCMLSNNYMGGCICENPPGFKIDSSTVEIAALMAPKPMIDVTATGDWTRDAPTKAFPAVQHIYDLFGAGDKVSNFHQTAPHNYNKNTREAVYSWFNKWLPENPKQAVPVEQAFQVEPESALRVFAANGLQVPAVDAITVVKNLKESDKAALRMAAPVTASKCALLRETFGQTLRHALSVPRSFDTTARLAVPVAETGYTLTKLVISERSRHAAIPALLLKPTGHDKGVTVLMVHGKGNQAFFDGGKPGELASRLLKSGRELLLIDTFNTGEHLAPVKSPVRDFDKDLFEAYNRTDTAERVYDILTALDWVRKSGRKTEMIGAEQAGLWCMLARPFAPSLGACVCDTNSFDTSRDMSFASDNIYVPCLRRAGDFQTAQALAAPQRLLIHNTEGHFDTAWGRAAYKALGRPESLTVHNARASELTIADWLLKK